jgi:hypothetical protein
MRWEIASRRALTVLVGLQCSLSSDSRLAFQRHDRVVDIASTQT